MSSSLLRRGLTCVETCSQADSNWTNSASIHEDPTTPGLHPIIPRLPGSSIASLAIKSRSELLRLLGDGLRIRSPQTPLFGRAPRTRGFAPRTRKAGCSAREVTLSRSCASGMSWLAKWLCHVIRPPSAPVKGARPELVGRCSGVAARHSSLHWMGKTKKLHF